MKTMPFCSALASALALTSSSLTSLAASSSIRSFCASAIFILRVFFLAPPMLANMPRNCSVISSMPGGPMISIDGFGLGDFDLDLAIVEQAFAQALAQHLARGVVGRRRRPPRPSVAARARNA